MKYCSHCGKELLEEALICPHCGCSLKPARGLHRRINPGWCVLSALIPLFGIFYWGLRYDAAPRRARACGITALVTMGILLLLWLILWLVGSVIPAFMVANGLEFAWQ